MSFLSYSQNGEDVLLWRALGHLQAGFYIDVGANDPVADSVTKAFYDAGWHGINIEPLPAFHQALQAQRPRDINLGVAAGAGEGSVTLFDVPAMNGWASPDPQVAEAHHADGYALAELTVPMRTLSAICAEHAPAVIHFLKVDVEGFEGEVLRGMDLERWRPWLLVIEATVPNSRVPNHAAWEALVTGRGYRHAWFDGLNRYYVADEHASLIDRLALQPNVFDDVVPYRLDIALKAHAAAQEACRHERARAVHARQRQQLAPRRARRADAQARQAQSQLALAQDANASLQAKLAQLRADFDAQGRRSHALQAWASELEQHLMAARRSTSWRVTAPLRLAGALPRRLRAALRRLVLRASASERLRRLFIPVLLRFPGHVVHVSRVLAEIRQPDPPPAANPDLPDELRAMPMEARRVLADLQRACRRD